LWNGLTSTELAGAIASLVEPAVFQRARAESPVHHLAQDPTVTKFDILQQFVEVFRLAIDVEPVASGRPVSRVLGSRYSAAAALVPARVSLRDALADLRRREE
jgi:dTDP-4-dehydrorhamnose reductase